MLKIKKIFALVIILSFCLCFSTMVFAHTVWINASDYSPASYSKFGAKTKVYFGYGHHYPVDDFLSQEQLEEFYWVCPRCGKHHVLSPDPGGFLATQLSFKEAGTYIVSAVLKPGFYTMYVDKGRVHHKIGPKTGLKNVIMSLYYEQYAKCLINTGGELGIAFKEPVGNKLEIIPQENPIHLKEGDFLSVKVLFEGKPAKFWPIYATYSGFSTNDDFAYTTLTDSKGIAKIRLLHHGPWLIKAANKLPAPDDLKDKCNELHYTATLTFEIP